MIGTDSANSAEPDQAPQITVSDKVIYTEICLFTECILKFERNGKLLPILFSIRIRPVDKGEHFHYI